MSSPLLSARTPPSTSRARTLSFPPIYAGRPVHLVSDPFGLLPYNHRIRRTTQCVLTWCNKIRKFVPWGWPVLVSQRVPPSDFDALRQSSLFHGPSCLCASQDSDPDAYTEAAVFMVTTGNLAGQYVAACTRGRCQYWIFLEKFYIKRGLPFKVYLPRGPEDAVLPPVRMLVQLDESGAFPATLAASLNRSTPINSCRHPASSVTPESNVEERAPRRQHIAIAADPFDVFGAAPPARPCPEDPFGLLMKMDATVAAGITINEFQALLARCQACNLVMTKRVFEDHICGPARLPSLPIEIIDLTGEDDD